MMEVKPMPYNPKRVGHRIKVLRAEAQMTQEELARASGISTASVVNYESGVTVPTLANAFSMAEALHCSPNDLCGWPGNE